MGEDLALFLRIFLGAPFIERLCESGALLGALRANTAAVVGVILNLAIWYALHVISARLVPGSVFGARFNAPPLASVDPTAPGVAWRLGVGRLSALAL